MQFNFITASPPAMCTFLHSCQAVLHRLILTELAGSFRVQEDTVTLQNTIHTLTDAH